MDARTLLENLTRRGVRLTAEPPKLVAEPSDLLTDEDRQAIRAYKAELLGLLAPQPAVDAKPGVPAADDSAGEALAILLRLKGYTLPAGRMPAARAIVERCPLLALPELDPAEALAALTATEAELTALGGIFDPDVAAAIGLVGAGFPGARLIEVRKLQ